MFFVPNFGVFCSSLASLIKATIYVKSSQEKGEGTSPGEAGGRVMGLQLMSPSGNFSRTVHGGLNH